LNRDYQKSKGQNEMIVSTDAKGNIVFLPDDIPAEIIPVPSKDNSAIPNPANIPGIESAYQSEADIPTAPVDGTIVSEPEPIRKKIETPMLNNYGDMTKEEMFICFYNREKPRCAEADDESLMRMLKEIRLMMEILKIRERTITGEDNERETKRSRKAREERKRLDSEYKPKTNLQKSAAEELEEQQRKQVSQKEKAILTLMNVMGMSREDAVSMYEKKGK